jgi:hypothetical protein
VLTTIRRYSTQLQTLAAAVIIVFALLSFVDFQALLARWAPVEHVPPATFIQGNWERPGIIDDGPLQWKFENGSFQHRWSGGIHFPGPSMQRNGTYEVLTQTETSITLLLHGYQYSNTDHTITFTIDFNAGTLDDGRGPFSRFEKCPVLTLPFNLTEPLDCP